MKRLIIFSLLIFCLLTINYGQSCGGGTATFHIYNESGLVEIKDFYVSLHIVSEEQDWRGKDFSKFGWKRQIFDKKTIAKYESLRNHREHLESAFEIPSKEFHRLFQERQKILEKNPKSIVATEKDRCGNFMQDSSDTRQKPFNVCTREGCSYMVVAQIQAKGYETAYFVSDFICGCTKHYEFRLQKKRAKE